MMRSCVIISNPGAGGRARPSLPRIAEALDRRGLAVRWRLTAGPGDATRLAGEAVASGAELIVVHGGDGTVNEALQPLVGGATALAVWPAGTSNVLARELGLPRDFQRLADTVAAGRLRRVSVGRAAERAFVLMAGVGLDAAVVRSVNPRLKRFAGEGAYWAAGLRQLVRWRPRRFLVDVEGRHEPATFAVIANAASYGGGLRLAPRARMDDEVLDLCLFDVTVRRRFLRYLVAGFSGSHVGLAGVTYAQAREATARDGEDVPVQVDGELWGTLPMRFACVPAALSVVIP
jgi:YegS/Rv2252/BmrU family lipid kinase